jgi:hypothetical protein
MRGFVGSPLTRLLGVIALAAFALSACGSGQEESEVMLSEGVLTCEAMLEEFAAIDEESATEDALSSAMHRADEAAEACETRFSRNADSEGDQLLFAHRSDQLRLFSLFFEAALSRRFDGFDGYCDILGDIVRLLVEGINEERQALDSGNLSDEDRRKVRELLELDVKTLEVVSVQVGANCPHVR